MDILNMFFILIILLLSITEILSIVMEKTPFILFYLSLTFSSACHTKSNMILQKGTCCK